MATLTSTDPDAPRYVAPVILVVEDEDIIRYAITKHLVEHGFRVHEAANASEAVSILLVCDINFDVVFTDINMPGPLNGLDLRHWIKAHKPALSVILTSGRAPQIPGDCDVLAKPYAPNHVVECIEKAMGAKPPLH